MRNKKVIGNWKLNGTLSQNQVLLSGIVQQSAKLQNIEIVVCPSHIHIPAASQELTGSAIALGAQNLSDAEIGAFTGEISAAMLVEYQCKYAIIGHSERRHIYRESQDLITNKVERALAHGLVPVYCVGETITERESGKTEEVIAAQLDPVIEKIGINAFAGLIIAYEPVWAIGTGLAASTDQAQQVHEFIRQRMAIQSEVIAKNIAILYGGSVKPNNAAELFEQADIDGGLIGGASLNANDFIAIAKAANG